MNRTNRRQFHLLIGRDQRRHFDHLPHFGHRFKASLQCQGFFARMRHAHGVPRHARAAVDEFVFPGHGIEVARLQVQQIVIVGEPRRERPATQYQEGSDGEHDARTMSESREPCIGSQVKGFRRQAGVDGVQFQPLTPDS